MEFDSLLEKEDIESMIVGFNLFADRKGYVDSRKLGELLRFLGHNPTEKEQQDMMLEVVNLQEEDKARGITVDDSASEEKIERRHFLRLIINYELQQTAVDELKFALRAFDRNDTGFVLKEELRYALTHLGNKFSDEQVGGFLQRADLNNDGQVAIDDFIRTMFRVLDDEEDQAAQPQQSKLLQSIMKRKGDLELLESSDEDEEEEENEVSHASVDPQATTLQTTIAGIKNLFSWKKSPSNPQETASDHIAGAHHNEGLDAD